MSRGPSFQDAKSIFRYYMHALSSGVMSNAGTSTLFAAWNAAIYVAQIEDARLGAALGEGTYLGATREVLQENNGLWFHDESYMVSRKRN